MYCLPYVFQITTLVLRSILEKSNYTLIGSHHQVRRPCFGSLVASDNHVAWILVASSPPRSHNTNTMHHASLGRHPPVVHGVV